MPLYPAASKGASSRASTTVACRCCPGGASRSTRVARYPSDMSDAEWAVTEPTLPEPAWKAVKAAETVAKPGRGFDAGKKINGRKRHIAVDVMGLLLVIVVTAASVQDRDAARELLWHLRSRVRTITLVWADGGYAGKLLDWAQANLRLTVEIVKRTAAHAFVVLRRRWVVERTFAWITRSRRTVRDYERLEDHHAAMVYWSMIIIMTRRLARQTHGTKHAPPAMQKALLQAA
jgi:transposase